MQTHLSMSGRFLRGRCHPFASVLLLAAALGVLAPTSRLHAQTALPTVSALATKSTVDDYNDSPGQIVLSLSSPATAKLKIAYVLRGSAVNGKDYTALSGKARIKAGNSSATIDIAPIYDGVLSPEATKVVKLVVKPGNGYDVGTPASAKVKIIHVIVLP